MEKDLLSILQNVWKYPAFRNNQLDIIKSVISGNDTLALLPTGGGKSICYQLPSLYLPGITIVITPLIALMKDQVESLKNRGIAAAAIYSGMGHTEVDAVLSGCIYGETKLLYLSPERLLTESIMHAISKMKLNFFAVDEAHCISEWGYDFRPSYLQISQTRQLHPEKPVLALTATATPRTREDIMEKLDFKNFQVFTSSFQRPNLQFLVYKTEDKFHKLKSILKGVNGSSIVYVRTRRQTRLIAEELAASGFSADHYHAGLPLALRNRKQNDWLSGEIQTIVSTNAFGMGIDKSDVRVVVHLGSPDSLESYYQEAGRAGRDGKRSFAVLLYDDNDIKDLKKKIEIGFPDKSEIQMIYQTICNYLKIPVGAGMSVSYDFDISAFADNYDLNPLIVASVIKTLEKEGFWQLNDAWYIPAKIKIEITPPELYKYRLANPELDKLLVLLLRISPGVFSEFTPISENRLITLLQIKADVLRAMLKRLLQDGTISLTEAKHLPQLVFLSPREEAKYLEIDEKAFQKRKLNYKDRVDSMLNYITNTGNCRVVMLLNYLGERPDSRCGTCDYCRGRNELNLNEVQLDQYAAIITSQLGKSPVNIDELVSRITNDPVEMKQVLQVIRWMADQNRILLKDDLLMSN